MNFLKYLKKNIKYYEVNQLELEGFKFPNDFSIDNLKELIKSGKFLAKDYKEFCFAIYETPIEEIQKLQLYLRVAIYALFLFTYFKENGCIDNLDEIYLYLFLKTALKSKIKHVYILNFGSRLV